MRSMTSSQAESENRKSIGICQKKAILLDSVGLVQAQKCQVGLTYAER